MKKIFLSLTLILFAIAGFSQSAPKPVQIDSLVTVSLPPGFQKKDTLGQHIYSANAAYGYMTVIVAPNEKNNTPLKKETDLNDVFKKYIKSIQGQSGDGSAQNVRDTTIGSLKAKLFTLKSDDGNGGDIQYINFILVYTKDVTYTLEYVYPELRKDLIKDEYKAFAASIRLSPNLQRNDQYISNASGLSSPVKIGIYGGGALVVILVIVAVVRRKKKIAM